MKIRGFIQRIYGRTVENKLTMAVFLTLRLFTYGVLIFSLAHAAWAHVLLCVLSLLLLFTPFLIEELFSLRLPAYLAVSILAFVFCATVLGEIGSLYVRVKIWDSALHTFNGFLCAGIGYSLADVLNRHKNLELSPLFLAVVAVCFSVTVSVFWEFFEFFADSVFSADMQKDFFIRSFSSVALDDTATNTPVRIAGIAKTVLFGADGSVLLETDGYLDVGLKDTMKDLLLGTLGAVIFALVRYFSSFNRRAEKWTRALLPTAREKTSGKWGIDK